jgi:hypothetical protein
MSSEEDRIKPRLEPLHNIIYGCLDHAITDYHASIAPLFPFAYKRMRASCISNKANENLREACEGIPGVRTSFEYERVLLYVGDDIRLRLKKLTPELRSRNNPTQFSINFERQGGEQLLFDFCPPYTNVTAGYVLDEITGEFQIFITCPVEDKNLWEYEIRKPSTEGIIPAPRNEQTDTEWEGRKENEEEDRTGEGGVTG